MSYLRFSPDEYGLISRLAQEFPLRGADLPALKHFLVAYLPLDRLDLTMRISRLDNRQMRLLYEHLKNEQNGGTGAGDRHPFTDEEMDTVAEACSSIVSSTRFLRYFRVSLINHLRDTHPELTRKVARLSERQFERLYEQVKGRRKGST
jgi:hypothetical protein